VTPGTLEERPAVRLKFVHVLKPGNGAGLLPALAFACVVATGCASSAGTLAPGPSPTFGPVAHAIVPLGINDGSNGGFNLTLRVGGGRPHPYLFDTGSTGLWVYRNAVGRYAATKQIVTNQYGSGLIYSGILAYATVDFGNGLVAKPAPVAVVQSASCKSTVPDCPAHLSPQNCPGVKPGRNAGIRCLEAGRKLYGTFGASLSSFPIPAASPIAEMYNVFFAIDAPWAARFVVTPTAVELGPYATEGFTMLPLTAASPLPQPIVSGATSWKRDVTACFTVGSATKHFCIDTLFDTGASSIAFQVDNPKLPLVDTKCGYRVKPRTPVEIRKTDGTVLASFEAGNVSNWNVLRPESVQSHPQVNTGLTFFNRDDILFDAVKGRVGLRPLKRPAHAAQRGCNGA
jgi:hypothetical protein